MKAYIYHIETNIKQKKMLKISKITQHNIAYTFKHIHEHIGRQYEHNTNIHATIQIQTKSKCVC